MNFGTPSKGNTMQTLKKQDKTDFCMCHYGIESVIFLWTLKRGE